MAFHIITKAWYSWYGLCGTIRLDCRLLCKLPPFLMRAACFCAWHSFELLLSVFVFSFLYVFFLFLLFYSAFFQFLSSFFKLHRFTIHQSSNSLRYLHVLFLFTINFCYCWDGRMFTKRRRWGERYLLQTRMYQIQQLVKMSSPLLKSPKHGQQVESSPPPLESL